MAAETAAGRGVAGSGAGYSTAVRMTDEERLRRMALGEQLLSAATARNPAAPIIDPTKFVITPYQQAELDLQRYIANLHWMGGGGGGGYPRGGGGGGRAPVGDEVELGDLSWLHDMANPRQRTAQNPWSVERADDSVYGSGRSAEGGQFSYPWEMPDYQFPAGQELPAYQGPANFGGDFFGEGDLYG